MVQLLGLLAAIAVGIYGAWYLLSELGTSLHGNGTPIIAAILVGAVVIGLYQRLTDWRARKDEAYADTGPMKLDITRKDMPPNTPIG